MTTASKKIETVCNAESKASCPGQLSRSTEVCSVETGPGSQLV